MKRKTIKKVVILSMVTTLLFSMIACNNKDGKDSTKDSSATPTASAKASSTPSAPASTAPASEAPATTTPVVDAPNAEPSTLTFFGDSTVKIKSKEGKVIYIDPNSWKGDFTEEADIVLVTCADSDRQPSFKIKTKADGLTITYKEALVNGEYKTFDHGDIKIEAVAAGGNLKHEIGTGVGYLITVDGKTIYYAGATSTIDEMKNLKEKNIDYALYPIDGIDNMGVEEAIKVSDMIGAKHNIPVYFKNTHNSSPKELDFKAKGAMILAEGETTSLADK